MLWALKLKDASTSNPRLDDFYKLCRLKTSALEWIMLIKWGVLGSGGNNGPDSSVVTRRLFSGSNVCQTPEVFVGPSPLQLRWAVAQTSAARTASSSWLPKSLTESLQSYTLKRGGSGSMAGKLTRSGELSGGLLFC